MKWVLSLFTIFLFSVGVCPAQPAEELAILVIAESESHPETGPLVQRLQSLRLRLGLSDEDMPIRLLTSEHDAAWISRLGTSAASTPVVGVVLWNETDSLGPRRFLGDAFVTPATPDDCPRVAQSFLRLSGRTDQALPPFASADPLPIPRQKGIQLAQLRFEASGAPLLLTNFAVRLHNESLETVRGIKVRFYVKRKAEMNWRFCEEKLVTKIASFQTVTAEYVGDTSELLLLDPDKNAISCQYKVEVLDGEGRMLTESGSFVPSERPVG